MPAELPKRIWSAAAANWTKYNNAIGKCETKFATKWQKADQHGNQGWAMCPDSPLTGAQFKTVIDEHSDNITTALSGGGLEDCPGDLPQCQSDLAACLASTLPAARVLKTGQTGCYDPSGSGNGISCGGTGQDGELQKGLVRSYTDNGDGTVTDNQTGLTWEKKSDDGSIHDKDTLYTWSDAFSVFIAGLNTASFAGHNDWRLPNRFELESLVDLGQENPSIDAAFNNNCIPACTVDDLQLHRIVDAYYWSSTAVVSTSEFRVVRRVQRRRRQLRQYSISLDRVRAGRAWRPVRGRYVNFLWKAATACP